MHVVIVPLYMISVNREGIKYEKEDEDVRAG